MTVLALSVWLPTWQRHARKAFEWWLAELAAMLPTHLPGLTSKGGREGLTLTFARGGAHITAPRVAGAGSPPVPLDADSIVRVRQLFGGQVVRIALANDLVFHAALELPAAAEPSLAQIIRHQLDRLMPLDPETIVPVWWISERVASRKTLRITVAIVKFKAIEQALGAAAEVGLRSEIVSVICERGVNHAIWRAETSRAMSGRTQRICRTLEAATVCSLLLAYGVNVIQCNRYIRMLSAERSSLLSRLAETETEARRTHDIERRVAAAERRLSVPTPLAVLDALSVALPLDAWLTDFRMNDAKVQIAGVGVRATSVLEHLARSPVFVDPFFTAPITSFAGSAEHFELKFGVSPVTKP